MSIRGDLNAIDREAEAALPGAALIPCAILLLSIP